MTAKKKSPKEFGKGSSQLRCISMLGDLLLEQILSSDTKQLEVFDYYAHTLRLKVYARIHNLDERLTKGYQVLCNELKTQN